MVTGFCRVSGQAFHFQGVKFDASSSATAIASWCGTVVGSASFELEAGGDTLVGLSPEHSTVLNVTVLSDVPDDSSAQADLVLHYHDQALVLAPLDRSGTASRWKV